jgi:hypothetical protein
LLPSRRNVSCVDSQPRSATRALAQGHLLIGTKSHCSSPSLAFGFRGLRSQGADVGFVPPAFATSLTCLLDARCCFDPWRHDCSLTPSILRGPE